MSWWRRFTEKITGGVRLPEGVQVPLTGEERIMAVAELAGGGHLVATSYALVVAEDEEQRRISWHLVSKAVWGNDVLVVTEAAEQGEAGEAVLLADLPPRRYPLAQPAKLPDVVHARVTGSIRSTHRHELPGGGAWFVQRKIPGRDGVLLQVRADPGTDEAAVRALAADVARKLREAQANAF
ncbi:MULTISPECIES: hypothetical protein [unclassified Crossiella]|uniref:hypothetical protein n=1 Tax=unclassified Crossiella TaxID=2620835 RepID=UPI001FFF3016|nr:MULTISPECIES: hypothetical protein [unclassified Crossiella]MCK2241012.1 hypothetical protein [Crossiella sp. S99.2]MCK2253844.1 hypothetical protein [Crossiella sp. S99.1]